MSFIFEITGSEVWFEPRYFLDFWLSPWNQNLIREYIRLLNSFTYFSLFAWPDLFVSASNRNWFQSWSTWTGGKLSKVHCQEIFASWSIVVMDSNLPTKGQCHEIFSHKLFYGPKLYPSWASDSAVSMTPWSYLNMRISPRNKHSICFSIWIKGPYKG